MTVTKKTFLRILAIHISNKFDMDSNKLMPEEDLRALEASLSPYILPLLQEKQLIKEERVDVDKLQKTLQEFFTIFPLVNFPLGKIASIPISKEDGYAFLKDLEKAADIETVPCLE